MNLFGKAKAKAPGPSVSSASGGGSDPAKTIANLRSTFETLEKRENHIQKKIELALTEAKQKASRKDKRGALYALKRKRMYEGELAKLQGARITMESQINALESAAINIEVFRAMNQGTQALKAVRGNLDADKIDDMMEEMEEENEVQQQISEAISRPVGGDICDDEDLLKELEELEELEMQEQLLAAPPAAVTAPPTTVFSNLPSVPTGAVKAPTAAAAAGESEEERALRELQDSMLA